jgi:hypothetical protein
MFLQIKSLQTITLQRTRPCRVRRSS